MKKNGTSKEIIVDDVLALFQKDLEKLLNPQINNCDDTGRNYNVRVSRNETDILGFLLEKQEDVKHRGCTLEDAVKSANIEITKFLTNK